MRLADSLALVLPRRASAGDPHQKASIEASRSVAAAGRLQSGVPPSSHGPQERPARSWLPPALARWYGRQQLLQRQRRAVAGNRGIVRRGLRGYKVIFWHEGQRHHVVGLQSQEQAQLVCNALTIKAAVGVLPEQEYEGQHGLLLRLDGLRLLSWKPCMPSSFRWSAGTGSHLRGTAFQAAVLQLQECALRARRLLSEGGQPTGAALLRAAACRNHVCAIQLLLPLLRMPEAALDRGMVFRETALHWAAQCDSAQAAAVLLAVAPPAAAAKAEGAGGCPLHWAVQCGAAGAVRALLAAAPGTAELRDLHDSTPLHYAAMRAGSPRCMEVLQLLLGAAPAVARAKSQWGLAPLHLAAESGCLAAVRLLLAAAPDLAAATDVLQRWPAHAAADAGHAAVVELLLAAAPAAAAARDRLGRLPLALALKGEHWRAVGVLAGAGQAADVLLALANAGAAARHFIPSCVAAHAPLAEAEWALVPAPCLGLARALPAALAHSAAQARQLVRRLPAADACRLRAFAVALARLQRTGAVPHLPQLVVDRLLSHFDA